MVRLGGDNLKQQAAENAQPAVVSDEELVVLRNATLHSFKLMTTGLGFDVHLTVALDQRDKLPALTMALHRIVDVHVIRYSRRARRNGQTYDYRMYYEGLEDDDAA